MLRSALTLVLAMAAIGIGASMPAAAATRAERGHVSVSAQSDLIALVNAYRANNGLQAVAANGALTSAATWMAGDMAAKNYIGHVSSDGRSPTQRMSAFGYPAPSMYTGEDLGAGYPSAGGVLAGWQASAAHNAVLLNPNYNAVGIGLVYNESATYKWYWAADFGGPGGTVKVAIPPPPPPPPAQVARPAAQPVAQRAAPAPRGSAAELTDAEPAEEISDPAAEAATARIAFIEAIGERRIMHLFAVLLRMGAI
ncbi:MAG TPA: CAP domain-containing protein [Candidatus Bathyarchaeia archaeon]|nr:CAP domain-containing protein [Candidatus Bathyarchaeia archaeon]